MSANPSPSPAQVLVVDDEPDLRDLYELTLTREGYHVDAAANLAEAWLCLKEKRFDAVITDMRLPDGLGMDLLTGMQAQQRAERCIVMTAYGSAENAVEALKAGAFDYLTKPVDLKQFRTVVASAIQDTGQIYRSGRGTPGPAKAASALDRLNSEPASLRRMIGDSEPMRLVKQRIVKVARSMAPVLVSGESGTGKELVARAIHAVSARGAQPFIPVNCSAIPEQLLEAEFFGYRKGAFTGAVDDREGFFQAAHGGTLFLDEIGDLPLSMQSKLLRAIQERSVRPVGAVSELPVDVRLLSATHKDLGAEVQAGLFRQDLYYRLNVIQIRVPPLRERIEDLPAIGAHVLERLAREGSVWPAPRLTAEALIHLQRYPFPGNGRELENLLHRAVALSGGELIDVYDLGLPDTVFTDSAAQEIEQLRGHLGRGVTDIEAPPQVHDRPPMLPVEEPLPNDLAEYLDEVERDILVRALEQHRFNRTAAGVSLGLSLRQIRYRMARLGVNVGGDLTGSDRE